MKILIVFISIFFVTSAFTQVTEGEIIYETKVDLHRNIPDEMSAMKDRIPPYRTNKQILIFNSEESIFKQFRDSSDITTDSGPPRRRGFRFRNRSSDDKLYRNLATSHMINSIEFFGKKFLVQGETKDLKWKMTAETKQVGDYFCQKAVYQDSTQNIFVWFTPMIPLSAGPNDYGGLPGMILYVNINDGERIITAVDIIPKNILPELIEKPTEGEEISREDFEKLREEKMKEMREEYGGSNRRFFFRGD